MPGYDQNRIAYLEGRLAEGPAVSGHPAIHELEALADLYFQADSYMPALETINRLLELPEARTLSPTRRAVLESKAVACRLAQGDCLGALAQCRDLLRDEGSIDRIPVRARLHLQCGEALVRIARFEESREAADRGLALADQSGDLTLAASAINLLGRISYRTGDLGKARDLFEEALALYRRVGDDASTAYVRNNLGLIHKNLCEWDAAATCFRAALELHERNGQYAETANPLGNLGVVYLKSGDWPRAAEFYARAQQVFAEVGDPLRLSAASIGLGNIARLERRFDDAESLLTGALELARSHEARREEVLALEFLGELDYERSRPEAALVRYGEALALGERVAPEGDLVVEVERRRAEVLCALGRLDEADAACARALRLAGKTDDRLEHAVAHRVAGTIAHVRGRREEADRLWGVAVGLLVECRESLELGRTLLEMGRAASDPTQSRRYFYRAAAVFSGLSNPYWVEQAERELGRLMEAPAEPGIVRPASLLGKRHRAPSLVACSPAMQTVDAHARRAAITELTVLITGETGTGKELVARTIHGLSGRARNPFLAVNCGALRGDLALSQLFGHRKGAFTSAHTEGTGLVEAAHGGTLFMDEIGELPPEVQVTLLRFLESGEYLRLGDPQVRRADVRLIAATNRDLRGADEKLFRRDLLFRLNEIEIRVPALRERRDDIIPLARHFMAFYGGMEGPRLAPDAEAALQSYAWPGNVRELENVMKRLAALHSDQGAIDAALLLTFLTHPVGPNGSPASNGSVDGRDDRAAILAAYTEARGNKSRVALLLGVSRKTLYARLKRLNIELP